MSVKLKKILYRDNPISLTGLADVEKTISSNDADLEIVAVVVDEYTVGQEKTTITKANIINYHTWKVRFQNLDNNSTEFKVALLVLDHQS
ncbi:hypothetical protein I5F18_21285 [Bacillus halotolerans]|uniref:hypothetical protein n=1 Tax=Bacillus halotolerans TaxID=260554 RepID=UPI00192B3B7B|nr:hypothetical protein [Bacillus halotolerans]MBL4974823.1 hypothetical protein [Bacillus halotolerans]